MKKIKSWIEDKQVEILSILFIILALLFTVGVLKTECNNKARSFNHQWYPLGGCMIEAEEGFWIPLENYRYPSTGE